MTPAQFQQATRCSDAALARLERSIRAPISTLQDVWLEGTRLTDEVASLMGLGSSALTGGMG